MQQVVVTFPHFIIQSKLLGGAPDIGSLGTVQNENFVRLPLNAQRVERYNFRFLHPPKNYTIFSFLSPNEALLVSRNDDQH